MKAFEVNINRYRTLEEVRLEVNIKNVSAQTLDRVIKRKYVHTLAVFNVEALVYVDEVPKLYAQVVAGHLIHLDSALFYVIRAEANENGVTPLFTAATKIKLMSCREYEMTSSPNDDGVPAKQLENLHRCRVKGRD
jgi:hypothetical protein